MENQSRETLVHQLSDALIKNGSSEVMLNKKEREAHLRELMKFQLQALDLGDENVMKISDVVMLDYFEREASISRQEMSCHYE